MESKKKEKKSKKIEVVKEIYNKSIEENENINRMQMKLEIC